MVEPSSESDRLRSWAAAAPINVDLTEPEQDAWGRRLADGLTPTSLMDSGN